MKRLPPDASDAANAPDAGSYVLGGLQDFVDHRSSPPIADAGHAPAEAGTPAVVAEQAFGPDDAGPTDSGGAASGDPAFLATPASGSFAFFTDAATDFPPADGGEGPATALLAAEPLSRAPSAFAPIVLASVTCAPNATVGVFAPFDVFLGANGAAARASGGYQAPHVAGAAALPADHGGAIAIETSSGGRTPALGPSPLASLENSQADNFGAAVTNSAVGSTGATGAQVQQALDESGLSVNGSGIKVGVLSDSFNDRGGAAADEADGALPPAADVQVLKDLGSGGSDEGRAMMQIVHDIAPGSSLAFYTAFDSEQDFADGILALAAAGCKVICDDVSYFDEPFFQNGVVAQAIQTVEAEGVTYVTAAGNDASNAYQAAWTQIAGSFDGKKFKDAESFGGSVDQTITLQGGHSEKVPLLLEWSQPYGDATTNLRIMVFQNGDLVGKATNRSSGERTNPWAEYTFTGSGTYQIVIKDVSGPNPGLIKEITEGDGLPITISGANAGSVYGHAMTPGAITAGAVSVAGTPAFGVNPAVSESFSSSGAGTELLFADNGAPLASPDMLSPVAVSGVDDIHTTVPGGLGDFYGTSAASASLAGVAALLLSANPNLSPAQVEQIMEETASPMANSAVSGSGLVQVDPAVAEAMAVHGAEGLSAQDNSGGPLPVAGAAGAEASGDAAPLSSSGFSLEYKGFDYVAFYNGAYEDSDSLPTLVQTGANSIETTLDYGINVLTSQVVADPNYTESLTALGQTIAEAEGLGLSVMVRPLIDFLNPSVIGPYSVGEWREDYQPTNIAAFFASYKQMIVAEAEVAQANGAQMLSIGAELDQLAGPQYLSYWTDIISSVRAVFSGALTYSANWDTANQVSFWGQLNYEGVDCYIPLSNAPHPTLQQLINGWLDAATPSTNPGAYALIGNESPIQYFESLAAQSGKPLIFTELGYANDTGAAAEPWASGNSPDPALQAELYQAFFQAWALSGSSALIGAYFWEWDPNGSTSNVGPGIDSFSSQNSLAQEEATAGFEGAKPIAKGATVEFAAASPRSVAFEGSTGLLKLDDAQGFSGQIFDFTGNGILSKSDHIDLKDISFGPGTTVSYAGDLTGGILTVSDAAHDTANISLVGNYSDATFALSGDGGGGTLLIETPVARSLASGNFLFKALDLPAAATASVSPQDGGTGYVGSFTVDPENTADGAVSLHWRFDLGAGTVTQTTTQTYDVTVAGATRAISVTVGGPGNDTFVFAPGVGADVIANATRTDAIELDGFSSVASTHQLMTFLREAENGQSQPLFHTTHDGKDTVINLGDHDSITLLHIHLGELHAHNFIVR